MTGDHRLTSLLFRGLSPLEVAMCLGLTTATLGMLTTLPLLFAVSVEARLIPLGFSIMLGALLVGALILRWSTRPKEASGCREAAEG
jgi:hypothetical protein